MIARGYARFIEWLWFSSYWHLNEEEHVVKVKGWNCFLVTNRYGSLINMSIDFGYWPNWLYLGKRIFSLGLYKG